ncbi:MAG: PIN domain-containing protein, partial [Candidatus Omnitrophica bacterium]|nr:PIN domain-containing protein [Candidatus Omnitrophota bacterium]
FIEFWSAVFSQRLEEKLGKSYRENLKQKPEYAKPHFDWVKQRMKLLDNLLSLFQYRVGIITFFKDAHVETQKLAEKYCLDIYDAIHVLTMERVKVKDVVSFDKHFRNLHRFNFNVWCKYPTGNVD